MQNIFDAVIVGAGAIGTWVSKRLAEGGMQIALIEAGPELSPARDFVPDTTPQDEAPGREVQSQAGACSGIRRRFFVNDRDNPYTTPPDKPFIWSRGRQVGGRLHVWSRHVPRASDREFRSRDAEDIRSWPIDYETLAPHYERIERRLTVQGVCDGIPSIPDGIFAPPGPFTRLEAHFKARVEAAVPARRLTPARTVAHNSFRIPLPLQDALHTRRVRLLTNTAVRCVQLCDRTGRAHAVEAVDCATHDLVRIEAPVIVLCASAFESVRILLNSLDGRDLGPVGHYVFDHVFVGSGGPLTPDQRRMAARYGPRRDCWDFGATGLYLPDVAASDEGFRGKYGMQVSFSAPLGRWGISAFGEMTPRFENRVRLNDQLSDAWAIPALHIECAHDDDDRQMARHMRQTISQLAKIAGLDEFDSTCVPAGSLAPGLRLPGLAAHEAGGARMGRSPRDSVLTPDAHCWSYDNLFIVDTACFPSLPFQNPTLTAMAVADRACDLILRLASTPAARAAANDQC